MSQPAEVIILNEPSNSPAPVTVETQKSFVAHAKLIGIITFVSRVLGMAREAIAANYFGNHAVYSAFTFAFTIPNLFRKLLGEGALSAAFIPLYAQAVKKERVIAGGHRAVTQSFVEVGVRGSENPLSYSTGSTELSANDFAAASVNLLCAILLSLTIVGEAILLAMVFFLPLPADYLLATKLTVIMLPYVLLICGTAFLGSILQVHHRFAAITFTAVVSNLCLIVAMIAAAKHFDLHTDAGKLHAVNWLSFSVLIAGVLQIFMLIPSLAATGFRFRMMLHVWTPAVQKMVRMTIPVALSAGVLQISVLMDKAIAFVLSQGSGRTSLHLFGNVLRLPMAEGATQRLNWAQYMYQFPLGVFAIALATAIFPKLSADAHDEGREQFKSVLRQGIEASLFIGLPASIGMIVVRYPAIRLLFEHGDFKPSDTYLVATSTAIYSAAIWAFSLQQILNRAYYSLHDTTTPLVWGIVNLVMNTLIELPLLWTHLGECGMAVGTLVSFGIQAVAMIWMLNRRVGGMGLSQSGPPILKMIVASALMWIACVGAQHLSIFPHGTGRIVWAIQLAALMGIGGVVYFGACAAMGIDVTKHLKRRKKVRSLA